jgi:glycosyltransferase involved in cell wall biosynthesis
MKISVITVCYNAADTIEETLNSIGNQDYKEREHIVIDGKSTDGTLEVLQGRSDQISKLISESDKGIYDAMNKGLAAATGDLIGFLNADDIYADNSVLSDIASTIQRQNTDSVYGDLQYVSSEPPGKVIRNWKAGTYNRKRFKNGWMPPHPTFYARRKLFEDFGVFNTDFQISADYELMLRFLYKFEASSYHIPRVLVKMKVGGASNQSLKSRILANSEDRKAWKVNGLKSMPHTSIMKPLRKISQFWS